MNESDAQLIQIKSLDDQMIPKLTHQSTSTTLVSLDKLDELIDKVKKITADGAANTACENPTVSPEAADIQTKNLSYESAYVEARTKADGIISAAIYNGGWTPEKQEELDGLSVKLSAHDVNTLMQTYVENVVAPALARGDPMPRLPYF